MLYEKIKKYLSNNNIDINNINSFFEIKDLSDGNGPFIETWDEINIGIEKPLEGQLSLIDEQALLLEEKIEYQLQQLDTYHFNSNEMRQMTINEYFILSLTSEGRNLIAEQIQGLEQQIKLGVLNEADAKFEYFYNGGSVEITLAQLRGLYIFMINTVNANYSVYKAHIHAINALTTIDAVNDYDFTANYLKNQNLDIE